MKHILVFSFLILFFPSLAKATCFESAKNIQQLGELKTVLSCFEAEIKSLKKQLDQTKGQSIDVNTVKGLPEPKVSASTVSEQFESDLFSCKRQSDNVICFFQITNRKADDDFYFREASRAFDEFGQEYKSGLIDVGGIRADLRQQGAIEKHLISKLPTKASIVFYGISKERSRFAAINIDTGNEILKFRNVIILN